MTCNYGQNILAATYRTHCRNILKTLFLLYPLTFMTSVLLFQLIGLAVIGGGVYLAADKLHFVSAVFGIPLIASASYLIIAAGCIVFIISFAGCFGAIVENRALLLVVRIAHEPP